MKIIILVLLLMSLFLVSCSEIPVEKQCTSDRDCVPAQCCHATGAVNVEYRPDCKGLLCTMECVPETIDCGQGEIKCVDGGCAAVFT